MILIYSANMNIDCVLMAVFHESKSYSFVGFLFRVNVALYGECDYIRSLI